MKKRFVATLLALCMLLSIVPTSAFAASLDNDAAQSKQETLANDLTDSAKPDDTQGTPGAPKPDGAAQTPGEPSDKQPGDAKDTPDKSDADTVPDGNGGADKKDNPDADKQDNPDDGADKKDQDKNDQTNVNAVQEAPQQVDVSASTYPVYVYTKVTGDTSGLKPNNDGWYTIGTIQLAVPDPAVQANINKWKQSNTPSPDYIPHLPDGALGAALGKIVRYKSNTSVPIANIDWTQLSLTTGAVDYTTATEYA